MPVPFNMPKLGLTMEEGTIVEWLVPAESDEILASLRALVAVGATVLLVEHDMALIEQQ